MTKSLSMPRCMIWTLVVVSIAAVQPVAIRAQNSMRNSGDMVPSGWTGMQFAMSKDYPTTRPTEPTQPWRQLSFRTQSEQYIMALRDYALEGNVEVDWVVQNNAVRKWYHAPGLAVGGNGREFIRGMTRERVSRPGELHPNQTDRHENWAVGMYNPIGGYVLGRVWANPNQPDPSKGDFNNGAVAIKLLFTTAPVAQVPYLDGAPEWQGNIGRTVSQRSPQTLRLLQVDVAVRETRNSSRTGWVFGTFVYQNTAPGTDPWRKLVPVGLMWGNDPSVTAQDIDNGAMLRQQWINPNVTLPHLGWKGRLNGPVDNPSSSCLSCHAFAGFPHPNGIVPPTSASDDERMQFFRNIKSGQHPLEDTVSLDYSLQLSIGLANFPPPTPPVGPAGAVPAPAIRSATPAAEQPPVEGQDEEASPREGLPSAAQLKFKPVSPEIDGDPQADEKPDPAAEPEPEPGVEPTTDPGQPPVAALPADTSWIWLSGGLVAIVLVLILFLLLRSKGTGGSKG